MLEKYDLASDDDEPLTPEQVLVLQAVNDDQVGNQYINADFILGSAAEVERLWSIASLILTKNRSTMFDRRYRSQCWWRN